MSQFRKNMITGEWVIFAANRRKKPYHFRKKELSLDNSNVSHCQFCPGHEEETPDAVYQDGTNGKIEEFYTSNVGIGIHEVLVDTPNHFDTPENFSSVRILKILNVIILRLKEIRKKDFIKYIQVFKNNGPEAGASIAHSHWQIIGIPLVPPKQENTVLNFKKYLEENQRCMLCSMAEYELKNGERIIAENKSFTAFVPYAAKFSFEIMVIPKRHVSSLTNFTKCEIKDMSEILVLIFDKVNTLKNGISYNICFQEKPEGCSESCFHWYMQIFPRLGAPAGFEFATGCYINPLLPEDAAKIYRKGEKWNK